MRETLNQILREKRLAETPSVPPEAPMVPAVASTGGWIESLRKIYPPLLTVAQYCQIRNCCPASAYNDFKKYRGLALKDGRATRVVRDVALELLGCLALWIPEKERIDEKDRPYQRSRGLAPAVSDTEKLIPPAAVPVARTTSTSVVRTTSTSVPTSAPVVSQPRREQPKRVTATPAPAPRTCEAIAPPDRPAPPEPQSHPRRQRATAVTSPGGERAP